MLPRMQHDIRALGALSPLDGRYRALHGSQAQAERSVIVFGAMEAALTPLMEGIEREHAGVDFVKAEAL